jgi:hypothetical protein
MISFEVSNNNDDDDDDNNNNSELRKKQYSIPQSYRSGNHTVVQECE